MVTKKFIRAEVVFLAIFSIALVSSPDFGGELFAQSYLQLTPAQAKAALLCPTDESKQFVEDCFELVYLGKLPESVVLSSFQYAMAKPKNKWVYFEKSMELRCEKMRIDLAKLIESLSEK
ncbi:MAG: hypothetical protein Q4D38_08195 [Planctomycetia bacterium]|nr:hypothetical protein [Planctomycetia bacterium]